MQDSIGVQAGYMDLYISSLHDVPAEVYWNIKMAASPSTSGRIDELENLDDIEDETITERLIGLTEMFPESFRNFVCASTDLAIRGTKKLYSFGGSSLWIVSTSFTILALPLIFEVERAQAEEAEKQQQRQILLGPGAATTPGTPGMSLR